MNNQYQLSAKGLQNAASVPVEDDFTFNVQFRHYKCNKLFAAFISPYISRILKADPNFNSFDINVDDPNEYFKDVLLLMKGQKISITLKNMGFLNKVGTILGNTELIKCTDVFVQTPPDLSNCVDLISQLYSLNLDITSCSTFIAKNISKIPEQSLKNLNPEILYHIFTNPELKLENEDWLAEFATSLISSKGEAYKCLIQTVSTDKLSKNALHKFIHQVHYDEINESMWKSIIKRLEDNQENQTEQSNIQTFVYNNGNHSGILRFLSSTSDLILSATSDNSNINGILNMSCRGWRPSGSNPSFTMSFMNSTVKPTQILIGIEIGPISRLKLFGSNDNNSFNIIWLSEDDNLSGLKIFSIPSSNNFYRYLRIECCLLSGLFGHSNTISINEFEIFGQVKKNS